MSVTRPGRRHQRWSCWYGDRAAFASVLATFDELAVDGPVDEVVDGAVSESGCVERGSYGPRDERHGPWREILDAADVAAISEFSIARAEPMRSEEGDLWLEFSRRRGVVLKAAPGQVDRMPRVKAGLSDALAPGVPRWAWLRSEAASLVLAIVVAVVLEIVWLAVTHRFADAEPQELFIVFPIGLVLGLALLQVIGQWVPRFRLRERPPVDP